MSEHPILFSGPMVRAILAGQKTVTRRVVKPQPPDDATRVAHIALMPPKMDGTCEETWWVREDHPMLARVPMCPYGVPGDLLWVRETWAEVPTVCGGTEVVYAADFTDGSDRAAGVKYTPSIFMPRWASRLTLRVTDVRVERVREITEDDIRAEGLDGSHLMTDGFGVGIATFDGRAHFAELWDTLNAKRGHGWSVNPWVWVIGFERAEYPRE